MASTQVQCQACWYFYFYTFFFLFYFYVTYAFPMLCVRVSWKISRFSCVRRRGAGVGWRFLFQLNYFFDFVFAMIFVIKIDGKNSGRFVLFIFLFKILSIVGLVCTFSI